MKMIIERDIFFHEDDYCLIELISWGNFFDKKDLNTFFSNNTRGQLFKSISDLDIEVNLFESVLAKNAIGHSTKIYSGYSRERRLVENCKCFFYENYALFYEYEKNNLTKAWINYILLEDNMNIYPLKLECTLKNIGELYELMLVDWNEILVINLKEKEILRDYIEVNL